MTPVCRGHPPLRGLRRTSHPRLQPLFPARPFSLPRVLSSFPPALSFLLEVSPFFPLAAPLILRLSQPPPQFLPPGPRELSFPAHRLFPRRFLWKPCRSRG